MKFGWTGSLAAGICFAVFSIQFARASGAGLFNNIHHDYESTRALGMGDAFIASADDSSTVFYNPAGLSRIKQPTFTWGIAGAGYTSGGPSFYHDLDNAINSSSDDTVVATNVMNVLQANYGKPYSVRATASEVIENKKNLAVALVPADISIDLAVHNQAAPSVDIRGYGDTTFQVGVGYDVSDENIPGRFSWGGALKVVNREYVSQDFNTIDLVTNSNLIDASSLQEGYTLDSDFGMLYTPYIPEKGFLSLFESARPTIAVVGRDLLGIGFTQNARWFNTKADTPAPEQLYRVFDVGVKFEFPAFLVFSSRAEVDVRDIGHPHFSQRKGFHAGYELDWRLAHWLRGEAEMGVNQGYPTFGLGLHISYLKVEAVTYGEDMGSYDSPKENRMYAAKVSIEI